jgi:hypothetical protein
MTKEIKIIEGKVGKDIYGSWDDCSSGLYLDSDMIYLDSDLISTIFYNYLGKNIKVTIEEVESSCKDEEVEND